MPLTGYILQIGSNSKKQAGGKWAGSGLSSLYEESEDSAFFAASEHDFEIAGGPMYSTVPREDVDQEIGDDAHGGCVMEIRVNDQPDRPFFGLLRGYAYNF